jgi:hypothetical protein
LPETKLGSGQQTLGKLEFNDHLLDGKQMPFLSHSGFPGKAIESRGSIGPIVNLSRQTLKESSRKRLGSLR